MPVIVACMKYPFKAFDDMSPYNMLTLDSYEDNTMDPRDYINRTNLDVVDLLYTKEFGKCAVMKQKNKAGLIRN